MNRCEHKIPSHNRRRLQQIGEMLRQMRLIEGKYQDEFAAYGISRRQIQRGEYGNNLSLVGLFNLIDCYGYRLDEFFQGME